MTLIDTSPIVALVDRADRNAHKKCTAIFRSLKAAPVTTWPCLAEVFYLVWQLRGWVGQKTVLGLLTKGAIRVHTPAEHELARISELMTQYKDTPMDFADASLVSLAEIEQARRIFTLDSDFRVYRIGGKDVFEVISPDAE